MQNETQFSTICQVHAGGSLFFLCGAAKLCCSCRLLLHGPQIDSNRFLIQNTYLISVGLLGYINNQATNEVQKSFWIGVCAGGCLFFTKHKNEKISLLLVLYTVFLFLLVRVINAPLWVFPFFMQHNHH